MPKSARSRACQWVPAAVALGCACASLAVPFLSVPIAQAAEAESPTTAELRRLIQTQLAIQEKLRALEQQMARLAAQSRESEELKRKVAAAAPAKEGSRPAGDKAGTVAVSAATPDPLDRKETRVGQPGTPSVVPSGVGVVPKGPVGEPEKKSEKKSAPPAQLVAQSREMRELKREVAAAPAKEGSRPAGDKADTVAVSAATPEPLHRKETRGGRQGRPSVVPSSVAAVPQEVPQEPVGQQERKSAPPAVADVEGDRSIPTPVEDFVLPPSLATTNDSLVAEARVGKFSNEVCGVCEALSGEELDAARGGLVLPGDLEVSFGLTRSVLVNGVIELQTILNVVLTNGEWASVDLQRSGANVVQVGQAGQNTISDAAIEGLRGGLGSVIQNASDGTIIQNMTILDVVVRNIDFQSSAKATNFGLLDAAQWQLRTDAGR